MFRIADVIGEHRRASLPRRSALQAFRQTVAIKDIVAENEKRIAPLHEFRADEISLRQSARRGLFGVLQREVPTERRCRAGA